MAVTQTSEPAEANIFRKRGDTFPFTLTLTDENDVAIDITGFTFSLTVDPNPDPEDDSTYLFQLAGTVTDPVNGVVEFQPSLAQADQEPETYFYDVEMADGIGDIRTILEGEWIVEQDVTK